MLLPAAAFLVFFAGAAGTGVIGIDFLHFLFRGAGRYIPAPGRQFIRFKAAVEQHPGMIAQVNDQRHKLLHCLLAREGKFFLIKYCCNIRDPASIGKASVCHVDNIGKLFIIQVKFFSEKSSVPLIFRVISRVCILI